MSAKWNVAVYMAGNNSLSDAASVDLAEIEKAGASDEVAVCVFVKQEGGGGARRMVIGSDHVEQLGDVDSGDPQTVVDFVRWAMKTAPGERQAVVLWNHGGGFRTSDLDPTHAAVRGKGERALFTTTIRKILSLDGKRDREIAIDDATSHSLDTIEMGRVCKLLAREHGRPLELLGMDACLMSNLEVAYQVRADVAHIVGSEELEPGAGWPYDRALKDLGKDPGMDGAALGKVVVDRYVESYRSQRNVWPITQCAVATEGVEKLTRPLDALVEALTAALPDAWPALYRAQTSAVQFELDLVDLGSLCERLVDAGISDAVSEAAGEVQAALKPDGYVLAEGHLGNQVEGATGISVYLPAPSAPALATPYSQLEFAKRHRWDDLLEAYRKAVRAPQ